MARSGVDGATFWLAGAVRVLQKEVRELKGLLVERQSDLGKTEEEMSEIYTTEKQLKYAHPFDLTDTTSAAKSYGFGEALLPENYNRFRIRRAFQLQQIPNSQSLPSVPRRRW